jgi:enterochelin esterase-like enzyme
MKNKTMVSLLVALAMVFALCSCGGGQDTTPSSEPDNTASTSQSNTEEPSTSSNGGAVEEQQPSADADQTETPAETDYEYYNADYPDGFVYSTSAIADYKKSAATQQGTVEALEYETPAYAVNAVLGTDYTITKSVNVYLPYGYDPTQNYNILYLMHGGGDNQDYWLTDGSDRVHGKTTRNVVDHMIEDGLCGSLIIVTPTFYSEVEGVEVTDDQCAAVVEQLGEDNYSTISDLYIWYFQYELHDQIIPLVESKYATYAQGDVTPENLIATRDHRAYAGLSMGSITSMHSILMGNLDYISYVGSFSGAKTNVELFKSAIEEKFADYPVNYWFNGEGTGDIAFEEHYQFYYDVLEQMPDKFTDVDNAAIVVLDGAEHNYAAWIADLYNALLVFFQ